MWRPGWSTREKRPKRSTTNACCCGTMFRIVFTADSGDGAPETDEETAAEDEKSAAVPLLGKESRQEIDEQSACSQRPAAARRPTRARIEFMMVLPWTWTKGVTKQVSREKKNVFNTFSKRRGIFDAGYWTRNETTGRRKIGGIL